MTASRPRGSGAPSRTAIAGSDGAVDRAWLRWLEDLAVHGQVAMANAPRVGDLLVSVDQTVRDGWLPCDGTIRSRLDYPALAALLDPNPTPPDRTDFATPTVPDTAIGGRTFIRAR